MEPYLERHRPALLRPHRYGSKRPFTTCRATVRLAGDPRAAYFYPLSLRSRLLIPLRAGDPQVTIDLQSLLDKAYRHGRYGMALDNPQPCDPPLEGELFTRADELLKAAGKR
jgi:hypothetical protein